MITVEEWLNNNQLSLDIWHKKYQVNNETFQEWLDRVSGDNKDIKQLILDKKFLFGGRILSNRGTNRGAMSNCNSLGYIEDSLPDIMQANTDLALTYKAQGGQGLSLSKLRPKGTLINGNFPSDGIIPFMRMFNTTTESISQGGNRRGALLIALDVWHKDIWDFISIKSKSNEINNANLSVEIDDKFMQYVQDYYETGNNPTIHIKREYSGNVIEYDIKPVELYKAICKYARDYAEPGILFIDKMKKYNLAQYHSTYKIECTNACSEIPMTKHGACILGSINLGEYVQNPYTDDARIDFIQLETDIPHIVQAMDDIISENQEKHVLKEQANVAKTYRNVGIGVMGLNDLFVKLGITYGSEESIEMAKTVMNFIFRHCIYASADLAKKRGNFPGYESNIWDTDIIKNNFSSSEIEYLKKDNRLRNLSLVSIAPTGSIGTLFEVSTGAEPYFALNYTRKTVSLNNNKEQYYTVDIKSIQDYKRISGNNNIPSYFIGANDIPWKQRIDMQAVLQAAVDQAISSTINLPETTTYEDVEQIYLYAWKKGLKGVTIYVKNTREPILSTETPEEISDSIKINNSHELKRGDVIKASNKWVGLKRILTTGCGSLHCQAFFDPSTGELRECFLSKGSTGGCQNFMIGLSRMISLSARGGISIDNILEQLKSCGVCPSYAVRSATKKDTSKGSCCPVAVGNALRDMHEEMLQRIQNCIPDITNVEIDNIQDKEYEECPSCHEKTLTRQGGCFQCLSCGYSKCD